MRNRIAPAITIDLRSGRFWGGRAPPKSGTFDLAIHGNIKGMKSHIEGGGQNWWEKGVNFQRESSKGTKQANLSSNEIKKLHVLVPNKVEQEIIVRQLSILDTKIEFHQIKKQTLTSLFKTMLHELMTGQRRVNELEFEQ